MIKISFLDITFQIDNRIVSCIPRKKKDDIQEYVMKLYIYKDLSWNVFKNLKHDRTTRARIKLIRDE
jgi:hypothetical protein